MSLESEKRKRQLLLSLVFVVSLGCLALLVTAFATEHWVEAAPVRNVDKSTTDAARNLSSTKLTGSVRLGLFKGLKTLDNGLGPRTSVVDVRSEVQAQPPLFSFGLWVSLLAFGVLTAAWCLVSCGFALLNVSRKPVHSLSGAAGLYVWNSAALVCACVAVCLFLVAFFASLRQNVLTQREVNEYKWTSDQRATLGFSFWLLVGCLPLCLLAALLTWLSGAHVACRRPEKSHLAGMDSVFMY